MSTPKKPRKTEKFDIRMTEQEQFLVREAARLYRTTPTSFIRDRAVAAAEDTIHEQTRVVVNDEQWAALQEALSRPPRVLPGLKRLFAEPDPWDED